MVGSSVYLTGRAKDIIIRAGRNIYPHELEEAISDMARLRRGVWPVFGSPDPVAGTERLVVLAETGQTDTDVLAQLRRQVEATVTDLLGTPPDDVVLAPPGSVLKTSSGQLPAVLQSRTLMSRENLEPAHQGRVVATHASGCRRACGPRCAGQTEPDGCLYAAYVWALRGRVAHGVAIIALLPRRSWCQTVARATVQLYSGCPAYRSSCRDLTPATSAAPTSWLLIMPAILMVLSCRPRSQSRCTTSSSGNWRHHTSRVCSCVVYRYGVHQRFEAQQSMKKSRAFLARR